MGVNNLSTSKDIDKSIFSLTSSPANTRDRTILSALSIHDRQAYRDPEETHAHPFALPVAS